MEKLNFRWQTHILKLHLPSQCFAFLKSVAVLGWLCGDKEAKGLPGGSKKAATVSITKNLWKLTTTFAPEILKSLPNIYGNDNLMNVIIIMQKYVIKKFSSCYTF